MYVQVFRFLLVGTFASLAAAAPSSNSSTKHDGSTITFDCKTPIRREKLPVFKLGATTPFPEDILQGALRTAANGSSIHVEREPEGQYYYDGTRLVGFVDTSVGETLVLPNLAALRPAKFQVDLDAVSRFAANDSIIPRDDTRYSVVRGSVLNGAQQNRSNHLTQLGTYMVEGIIRREIKYRETPLVVHGTGSRASFSFSAEGIIQGITHQWRPATHGWYVQSVSENTVQDLIVKNLEAANLTRGITVSGIELCYYDAGNKLIQPVFRFNATVEASDADFVQRPIVGFVPASGEELEPLPQINQPTDEEPPSTLQEDPTCPKGPAYNKTRRSDDQIKVGRYVMKNDDSSDAFVSEAKQFWKSLADTGKGRVSRDQFYWDHPRVYSTDAYRYVDAVNLAFSDGHGNVHRIATDDDLPDRGRVYIPSSLPPQGFGPGAGGQLAHLILVQCSVMSSPQDYKDGESAQAFDPWWQVFQGGMHSVMGFRGLSDIGSSPMAVAGRLLGKGAPAAMSWLTGMKKIGKTAVLMPCGREGDTIYQIENLGRPSCLHMFWIK